MLMNHFRSRGIGHGSGAAGSSMALMQWFDVWFLRLAQGSAGLTP